MPGREAAREIWLHRNIARAGLEFPTLLESRVPLLRDPTAQVSYLDPAWSPDGRFLAYVQTDAVGSSPAIYVQEFVISEDIQEAATPVGPAILVVPGSPGVSTRRPSWSPDGESLTFDSTLSGLSADIYTVEVFPGVGPPVRRTWEDFRAEQDPAWSPEGNRIAYHTNFYGPNVIAIVDLTSSPPLNWTFAEREALPVDHVGPDWSSDGGSIYYHAPKNEDQIQPPDIWKLDLASQAKCAISVDLASDSEVNVSRYLHTTPDGIPFNYFLYSSMAGYPTFQGPHVWRGQHIFNCVTPLSMGVNIQPNTIQLGSSGQTVTATLSFPPETIAAGYQCASFDGPLEGVKMRITVLPSPTLDGILPRPDETTGNVFPIFVDRRNGGAQVLDVTWNRRDLESFLLSRGRLGKNTPLRATAYSNNAGRAFGGFAYVKLVSSVNAAEALVLEQNAPNPFNPLTKIHFSTGGGGTVAVRIFNARGQLVRTLAHEWFPQGRHALDWDGRDDHGREVTSGIYYAHAVTATGTLDRIKMVLMR